MIQCFTISFADDQSLVEGAKLVLGTIYWLRQPLWQMFYHFGGRLSKCFTNLPNPLVLAALWKANSPTLVPECVPQPVPVSLNAPRLDELRNMMFLDSSRGSAPPGRIQEHA